MLLTKIIPEMLRDKAPPEKVVNHLRCLSSYRLSNQKTYDCPLPNTGLTKADSEPTSWVGMNGLSAVCSMIYSQCDFGTADALSKPISVERTGFELAVKFLGKETSHV